VRHRVARRRLGRPRSYEGWDLSDAAIELARRRHPSYRFAVADIHEAEAEETSDIVVSVDSVACFRDQDAALSNVRRMLAPGGYLVLSTVNPFVYERISSVGPPGEGQVRKWLSRRELRALLERTSFEPVVRRTIMPAGDQGLLRWLNSPKLNAPLAAVFSPTRVRERCGLGQYRLAVARRTDP
jgi:SAM-dependent methyltransferase